MIEITRDIPKIYERVAVEEFYKHCQNVTKDKRLFNYDIHFTTDESKLSNKDLNNSSLMQAIKLVKNDERNVLFLMCLNEQNVLVGIARVVLRKESLDVSHILLTNYPDVLEKMEILNEIINRLEELTDNFKQKIINIAVVDDGVTVKFVKALGYEELDGLFTKNLGKREIDGPTLSRK